MTPFIFEFPRLFQYHEACEIALNPDHIDNDFNYCILRERGVEIKSCRDNNVPFACYLTTGEVIESTIPESYSGPVIPRLRSYNFKIPDKFYSFESEKSINKILDWPSHISGIFNKRNIKIVSHYDMADMISMPLEKPIFIKTKDKGMKGSATFHEVVSDWSKFKLVNPCDTFHAVHDSILPDSKIALIHKGYSYFNEYLGEEKTVKDSYQSLCGDFIVSDPIEMMETGLIHKKEEYRCFIRGEDVISISLHEDYESWPVGKDVQLMAEHFAWQHAGIFQEWYVLDIGRLKDGSLQVIELNPFCHSGRYIDNDALFGANNAK